MCSIVDILKRVPEELPGWLQADPVSFNRSDFFNSRTLYYPGYGDDGHPVSLCNRSHAVHAFVYVDYGVDHKTISGRVHNPNEGFRGYEVVYEEEVTEDTLRPGGWKQHVNPADLPDDRYRFVDKLFKPFAWFVVLQRDEEYDDAHGPKRIAGLFIGGDGHATYDALYCQDDGTPAPFLVVIQDHGFARNYSKFGRGGILERIARQCEQLPQWLLVGEGGDTEPSWEDYEDCEADADIGGMHGTPRRLYRRRN